MNKSRFGYLLFQKQSPGLNPVTSDLFCYSSTVTTLLVVGIISGGMMTLDQSVRVIMGANISSTVTAQLLAFNLSAYSLGSVAIGFSN